MVIQPSSNLGEINTSHILNPNLYYLACGYLLGQSYAFQHVIKTCTLSMSMDFETQSFSNLAAFLALLAQGIA